jgi:hypothetical protein
MNKPLAPVTVGLECELVIDGTAARNVCEHDVGHCRGYSLARQEARIE